MKGMRSAAGCAAWQHVHSMVLHGSMQLMSQKAHKQLEPAVIRPLAVPGSSLTLATCSTVVQCEAEPRVQPRVSSRSLASSFAHTLVHLEQC